MHYAGHVAFPNEYDERLKLLNERTGFLSYVPSTPLLLLLG